MRQKLLGFLIILGTFISCSDDAIKSSENKITEFALEEQIGNTKIDEDNSIYVTVSENADLKNLSATTIVVSDYATVSPAVGEKLDFTSPVEYTVTAEDGTISVYTVTVTRIVTTGIQQIPNSNFDKWHEVVSGEITYSEIGEDSNDNTWGTGNSGVLAVKMMSPDVEFLSTPYQRDDENKFAVKLETQNMGSVAAGPLGGGKGIGAGNLFTGIFNKANLINAHPVLGFPFTETPSSFKIDYRYFPGEQLFNGKLDKVDGTDALDMFVILERREGENVKRLGIGWFRNSEKQEEWTTLEVDIKYAQGKAPEGLEEYQTKVLKYGFDGDIKVTDPSDMGDATWGDITKEKPTHIVVVFSSSYQGDYFIGAPGSTLYIDNFELVYEE